MTASILCGLSVMLVAVGAHMSDRSQWHDVAVGDTFAFSAPVALAPGPAAGIDTAVGEWHGDGLLVRVDTGLFVDPLTRYQHHPHYRTFPFSVAGRRATGVAFEQEDGAWFTAAHFPDAGAPLGKLTLVVISRGAVTADDAERIVRSIRFRS